MKFWITVMIIISIIVAITIGFIAYVNKVVLPVKLKSIITDTLEEHTGYNVKIGSINYLPISQFYLNNVAFYDDTPERNKIIGVESLSLNLNIWPFLKSRMVRGYNGY